MEHNPGRKLLRYNFFMLQADVLPNMGFSATRKRLVYEYNCTSDFDEEENSNTGEEVPPKKGSEEKLDSGVDEDEGRIKIDPQEDEALKEEL